MMNIVVSVDRVVFDCGFGVGLTEDDNNTLMSFACDDFVIAALTIFWLC